MKGGGKKKLGEILVETGVISAQDLNQVLQQDNPKGKRLGELLVDQKVCSEQHIATALSSQLGLEVVDLQLTPIEPEAVACVPEDLARKHQLIPLNLMGKTLNVAIADPFNLQGLDDVRFATGLQLTPLVATPSDIRWAIDKHYQLNAAVNQIVEDIVGEPSVEIMRESAHDQPTVADLEKGSEAAPIITLVNHILSQAVRSKASDIHIEPARNQLIVRYRVDGHLRQHLELPKWAQAAVISRIKIMSQMDISEKRIPQDGRMRMKLGHQTLDLRVSSLPTSYGEKIVIRILGSQDAPQSIEEMGMEEEDTKQFLTLVSRPQGIILVTGPTGSGKSTTLYGALAHIKSVTKNITTVEDPVEHELEGVNQVGVNEKAGRTFASVLPALLRQDPDVIMVGEMRDLKTATIAMQASLTGHLVLSTIHTNDTISTVTRLRNLGLPSYLIASSVSGILAQRLLRLICRNCKTEETPDEKDLKTIGIPSDKARELQFHRGAGCPQCTGTGFSGRTGIFELLVLSPILKERISSEATEATIRQRAIAEGMKTLMQAGVEKVLSGSTSAAELVRVAQLEASAGSMCRQCEYILRPEFLACPRCGTRLSQVCPSCSSVVDREWGFCPYCATHLSPSITALPASTAKAS